MVRMKAKEEIDLFIGPTVYTDADKAEIAKAIGERRKLDGYAQGIAALDHAIAQAERRTATDSRTPVKPAND